MTIQKKILFTGVFICLNLLLLEAGARLVLVFTQEASFFKPSSMTTC